MRGSFYHSRLFRPEACPREGGDGPGLREGAAMRRAEVVPCWRAPKRDDAVFARNRLVPTAWPRKPAAPTAWPRSSSEPNGER